MVLVKFNTTKQPELLPLAKGSYLYLADGSILMDQIVFIDHTKELAPYLIHDTIEVVYTKTQKDLDEELTEAEAIKYFNIKMDEYDYTILKIETINDLEGKKVDIQFVLGSSTRIHTFTVWMEPDGIYGEW